ncbi:hypothetical protein L1987_19185 [Smallanthus sonchifolius]|uniref:Uncharacterized protein n=1 Tax=Smallanthus sonchifolius TaxID=185202 RepID=A0ACB9IQ13_9ASTR|nr:hypothetical protein L1987_19185 [Smallanthus sonchifolius]
MARTRIRRKHSKKKISSEGQRKKKSRRNKTKKLLHHDESFSSRSDDESTSSSSSSEGEYKRKRARSRSRNEIKGSKKRSRRRSLSDDSSEDSPPVKKRKRSKKSKKIKKKKRSLKRDAYISSASSDPGSCSTCKDEDSSSDEMGSHGRSRGKSREKKKDHRDSTKGRIGNMKNMSKTRSSISPSTSYGSERIEKVTMENNPMRLKSVITVANLEKEEEDNMNYDGLKEETVYDYDDYPSSKSNDSIELVDRFNTSPDKKSVVKEVNSGSNLDDNKEKDSNVSGNIGSEADNLELILRQKALENLSRFRGGIKIKPVVSVDDKPKGAQSGVNQLKHETVSMTPVSQPVINRSRFTWRRDPSVTTAKDEKAATYSETLSSGSQPAELKLQSANLSSMSRVDNKFVNETSKIMVNTKNVDQKSTAVVETPSTASIKEGEQQNESNDNSQFEKKTMSVMRGGETVQVSYKVYIPNRAPALSRRQLKR